MSWTLMLLVPAAAWVWHVIRAARGRQYPLISLAVALVCVLLVVVATRVVASVFYPPELAMEQEFDDGRAANTLTLFGGVVMLPLEPVVAGIWAAARALRSRRERASDPDAPQVRV